ncbi:TPA: hypothetical protein ACS8CE_003482 [Providencia alcalifaciens]
MYNNNLYFAFYGVFVFLIFVVAVLGGVIISKPRYIPADEMFRNICPEYTVALNVDIVTLSCPYPVELKINITDYKPVLIKDEF